MQVQWKDDENDARDEPYKSFLLGARVTFTRENQADAAKRNVYNHVAVLHTVAGLQNTTTGAIRTE
jgi:hypothetical protein